MSQNQHQAHDLIVSLASRGKYHFTIQDFATARGTSPLAARRALQRLSERGEVAMPHRGFLVIVPPEYRTLGCLPADQFIPQLMEYLNEPYYAALLSAAQYHGAAHQAPQRFQVITRKNRPQLHCGKIVVDFIAKANIQAVSTISLNTRRGYIKVSTPEVTALDLVGYQEHCGGLDNVATILSELSEKISPRKLVEAAALAPMPWVQRLGYLLSVIGKRNKVFELQKHIEKHNPRVTPLMPGASVSKTSKDYEFRIAINTEVEPDV